MKNIKICVGCIVGHLPITSAFCFFDLIKNVRERFSDDSEVLMLEAGPYLVQNRTYVMAKFLELSKVKGFDYFVWIDSDQVFTIHHVEKLVKVAMRDDLDAVSGCYFNRRGVRHAMVGRFFGSFGDINWLRESDFVAGRLLDIDVCGFGFLCLNAKKLVRFLNSVNRVKWFEEHWHGEFNDWYSGEDITFCKSWKKFGFDLKFCSDVLVGHFGGIIPEDKYRQSRELNRFQEVLRV